MNSLASSYHALDFYATGYLQAARYLGRGLVRGRRSHHLSIDMCIYPLVFLWRHYLELRLKELLITLGALNNTSIGMLQEHNLGALWGRLRPLITSYMPTDWRRADEVFR